MHEWRRWGALNLEGHHQDERYPYSLPLMQESAATVYIVDDDPAVRSALSLLVGTCGWKSKPYPSAEGFLESYARERPACLLLDLEMEGMSGVELQGLLNTLDSDLPVIVITSYADHPLADRAREAGAQEVLGKPFGDTELIDAVNEALGTQTPPVASVPSVG